MRQSLLLTTRLLVSGLLLYFAVRNIHLEDLWSRLSGTNLAWFISWMFLAILANLVQVFFGAMRWKEISAPCNAPLSLTQAFRYNMIGTFFNQTLPSTIGGDAMRLWLVKHTGAGWRAATYSVLVDRAIGLIALASLVVTSLPWSYELIANTKGRLALVVVDVAAISAGLGFLMLGALQWPWLKTWWPTHHFHACAVIANRLLFSRATGPKIAVLSITIHVLTVVISWCVVRSIVAPAQFEQMFLLIPPVALITMLPISIAGWGLREATMMLAFGYSGLNQADGTMVSLLTGVTSFLVGAIGGLVWIFSREKAETHVGALPDAELSELR
jgi:glycosyltransferase 2 family protein